MNDESLRQALRSLPRLKASPGFKGAVLDRIEKRRKGLGLFPRLALAGVAALILIAGGVWGVRQHRARRTASELRQQLNALKAEQRRIERELAELAAERPLEVLLDADDSMELVVGLRHRQPADLDPSRPRPASFRP